MTAEASGPAAQALPERPPISAPVRARARLARQPALGLAGSTLVLPVAVALGFGLWSPERSLLVLGPISTFALPVVAVIAFWWEDWPGTLVRAPLTGALDTALVAAGGIVGTVAGQAIVARPDLRGVFDPAAPGGAVPTFPATMPVAAAVFVAMLQLTLVWEGWPLRRLDRFLAGVAALTVAWVAGVALYGALVGTGTLTGGDFGSVLTCIGAVQVVVYVVLGGWPFCAIGSRAARLLAANASVLGAGCMAFLLLGDEAGLASATITSGAGSVVAAGLLVGMLFEGWLDGLLAPGPSRAAGAAAVAGVASVLYVGLQALALTARWTRAEPEDWTAYIALNAIGLGVILHVAIGRRWPFASAA